mgnify:CR=1 FL=1
MSISPGMIIDGKYSITKLIGEGGMGAVYEGTNTFIRRRVAIKVLLAAARDSAGVIERFEREAQAAGCIGSDHILEVLDLGTLPTGDRYMVMEFLDGESLADRIRRLGRMSPQEIAPLLRQGLVGLEAAHKAGIVHRDLKPDNVYIIKEKAGRQDFVKIIDFGISKFNALSGDMSMTRTGAVMGTPYYMSPEQAKGAGSVNHQSDIYSMGVIAFEALTGKVPFDGTTFNDLMFKIVLSEMPDLEVVVPGIDPGFAAIVRRAMSKDQNERFQDAEAFIAALDRWSPMARTVGDGTRQSFHEEPIPPTVPAEAFGAGAAATGFGAVSPGATTQTHAGVPAATNMDWAASQHGAHDGNQKKPVPTLVYGAAAALLVLAAGGVLIAKSMGGDEATPDGSLAPTSAAPNVVETKPPAPAEKPPVEPAVVTAPPSEPAKPTSKGDDKPEKPTTAKPTTAPKPVAEKPATAKPTTKPATKPGVDMRDFGY